MSKTTCKRCGSTFEEVGRGRPRSYCVGCSPQDPAGATRARRERNGINAKARAARYAARPERACPECGSTFRGAWASDVVLASVWEARREPATTNPTTARGSEDGMTEKTTDDYAREQRGDQPARAVRQTEATAAEFEAYLRGEIELTPDDAGEPGDEENR